MKTLFLIICSFGIYSIIQELKRREDNKENILILWNVLKDFKQRKTI